MLAEASYNRATTIVFHGVGRVPAWVTVHTTKTLDIALGLLTRNVQRAVDRGIVDRDRVL